MIEMLKNIFSIKYIDERLIVRIFGLKITYTRKKTTRELLLEANKNIENLEFKFNILMNHFYDVKDAKKASGMLRQHQINNCTILQEMVRICNENNLRYWIDFGSLLGAVRHGGFIPWDDDLDVSMPESDFNKLIELAPSVLNNTLRLVQGPNGSLRLERIGKQKGSIDVFAYYEKEDRLQKVFLTDFFPNEHAAIPYDIIFPLKETKFEDIFVKIPNSTDKYLRCRYGNYELFPKAVHACTHETVPSERIVFYEEN